jgi:hypothetical protein
LERAEKSLTALTLDSFIYKEKYYECQHCGADVPEEHYEDCSCLNAQEVIEEIKMALTKHNISSGG